MNTSAVYWKQKLGKKDVEQERSRKTEIAPWKTGGAMPRNGRAAGETSHQAYAEGENPTGTGGGNTEYNRK